jgi:hypothetical protein
MHGVVSGGSDREASEHFLAHGMLPGTMHSYTIKIVFDKSSQMFQVIYVASENFLMHGT